MLCCVDYTFYFNLNKMWEFNYIIFFFVGVSKLVVLQVINDNAFEGCELGHPWSRSGVNDLQSTCVSGTGKFWENKEAAMYSSHVISILPCLCWMLLERLHSSAAHYCNVSLKKTYLRYADGHLLFSCFLLSQDKFAFSRFLQIFCPWRRKLC